MEDHIVFRTDGGELDLLDQRLLPLEEKRFVCRTVDDVVSAMRTMVVRGAPAIGVSAAFGCALAVREAAKTSRWRAALDELLDRLARARPTAVNLAWAVKEQKRTIEQAGPDAGPDEVYRRLVDRALAIQAGDVASCRAMGRAALPFVPDNARILTHCNAGALATAGYGTALGVVRAAHEAGRHVSVIADETRPLLQGARLTAWELHKDGIPVTLATDNSCATLMSRGLVDLVVVGADRIAANGDTANKIGTFGVAIMARHFGIPFYVAAPLSTIDPSLANGSLIPIEERDPEEVRTVGTPERSVRIAPDVPAYNFAFDVTPAELITAIFTDRGALLPPYGEAIAALFA